MSSVGKGGLMVNCLNSDLGHCKANSSEIMVNSDFNSKDKSF